MFEYIIVSASANNPLDSNIGSDMFFKINRFYQNKCMETEHNLWKCNIEHSKLYIQKIFRNHVIEISDKEEYFIETITPGYCVFKKKNISFLKRNVIREIVHNQEQPFFMDCISNEINEMCFQIENIKTNEIYLIYLRIITNLENRNEVCYQVSYATQSNNKFFMLLPFYLWEGN